MSCCYPYDEHESDPWATAGVLGVFFAFLIALALMTGCAGKSGLPPQAPPAKEVLVPVTQPCEVEQVQTQELPSSRGVPHDIFEAVKLVLADRSVLKADRERLKAANTNPCPEVTK